MVSCSKRLSGGEFVTHVTGSWLMEQDKQHSRLAMGLVSCPSSHCWMAARS